MRTLPALGAREARAYRTLIEGPVMRLHGSGAKKGKFNKMAENGKKDKNQN